MSLTESGPSSIGSAWDRYAVAYQNAAGLPTDVVSYGPGIGTENDYRLLGPVAGKRVLDLGCGGGQSTIALARQGAIAIGVDISVEQLAYARRLIEDEDVRVELRHGDLAELAFQRADSIDIAFSAMSLQYVPDLNRVFRQVHRVLRREGTFVFSTPHPVGSVTQKTSTSQRGSDQLSIEPELVMIRRSYFEKAPMHDRAEGVEFLEYHRTISEMFMGLVRAGYRVDTMLEPELSREYLPRALVIRARKE